MFPPLLCQALGPQKRALRVYRNIAVAYEPLAPSTIRSGRSDLVAERDVNHSSGGGHRQSKARFRNQNTPSVHGRICVTCSTSADAHAFHAHEYRAVWNYPEFNHGFFRDSSQQMKAGVGRTC